MPRVRLPLTFEITRGTKTYYLPTERNAQSPPIVTLMLRRRPTPDVEQGTAFLYSAGMVVCSAYDRFERKVGRTGAFERLRWAQFRGLESGNPLNLLEPLMEQVKAAMMASPINLTLLDIQDELLHILSRATENFDEMDENRAKLAAKVQECCRHQTCDSQDFEDPTGL